MNSSNAENIGDAVSAPRGRAVPVAELFFTFSLIGLCGFGGVIPWLRRTLVDQKRWLDDAGFTEMLSIGQILPGATVTNLAVIFGYRHAGGAGALAAVSGLLIWPVALVLLLARVYQHYLTVPGVQGALHGMALAGTGLVLGTGLRLALGQPRTWRALLFGAATLAIIGVLHWPLASLAVVVPLAIMVESLAQRR
ncbi:chromate transporter [Burkholderia glumae]|uniref:chromate transporter n=1 Tax=Burkholderia glumae TaxID=337 RepID=UPI000F5F65AD|nr:chromate transporter [Burkholderia glumae]MCQ0030907.1 chromate transporter [Burkholderia glumae]MCQ0036138.1 chromate transporter [Burkholderia glumae]QJW81565.1 chromate transporter [Burkholderia glumae]RQZ71527.1 chromate transporter [Burkholderia glumae]UVS87700.1 chromate transporter [Burkholderia glumae]